MFCRNVPPGHGVPLLGINAAFSSQRLSWLPSPAVLYFLENDAFGLGHFRIEQGILRGAEGKC